MAKKPATRQESDAMGTVEVPSEAYWGAQTERARRHFAIGTGRFPSAMVRALARVKLAASRVNARLGVLDAKIAKWIEQAASEVIEGLHDAQFPLSIFISGSGTQFNMNVNEVIANRAIELAKGRIGSKHPVHPNDHVNQAQSTNDAFPTAMHLAALETLNGSLLPALFKLRDALEEKAFAYADALKIGRTHLQDAVPMTLGQEISGWAAQLRTCIESIDAAARHLRAIPIGGTAVGTGLNAPPGFAAAMVKELSAITGLPLMEASNKFAGLAAHDALAFASGALRTLAGALMKIANDIRWLASGPECGLGELELPANEPGSSIMPGKVNPTQAEAITQVAVQVYGNDAAVAFAASQGNLELNVYKPVIIRNVVESTELLADACQRFREYCVAGLKARPERLAHYVQRSDALITALVPHLGYDKCAEIVRRAHASGTSLREATTALGYASEEEFERWIDPNGMARPGRG